MDVYPFPTPNEPHTPEEVAGYLFERFRRHGVMRHTSALNDVHYKFGFRFSENTETGRMFIQPVMAELQRLARRQLTFDGDCWR